MHEAQQTGTVIEGRYRILGVLGQGGSSITYEAEDTHGGDRVALKELALKGLSDWKKLELFEREAQTLATLNHPAIPQYLDYFQVDTADNRFFYIVQAIAAGHSLADLVAAGDRFAETEVRRIGLAILEVLQYLHSLNPPIIHRDIKPQNIIRGQNGQIFLVDFGAVQTIHRETMAFGSTVVGTYGYMAPEQFSGRAYPVTDLYGLGMTLLNLLSHQPPNNLPQRRFKIDFRPYVTVSDGFAGWLDGLIDPHVEDRFDSAKTAIAALTSPPAQTHDLQSTQRKVIQRPKPPAGTRIRLVQSDQRLTLYIPPMGFRSSATWMLLCLVFFLSLILIISWLMAEALAGVLLAFFVLLLWVAVIGLSGIPSIGLLGIPSSYLFEGLSLDIQANRFTLTRNFWGWKRTVEGNKNELEGVESQFLPNAVILYVGTSSHTLGYEFSVPEKKWLVAELEAFIEGDR